MLVTALTEYFSRDAARYHQLFNKIQIKYRSGYKERSRSIPKYDHHLPHVGLDIQRHWLKVRNLDPSVSTPGRKLAEWHLGFLGNVGGRELRNLGAERKQLLFYQVDISGSYIRFHLKTGMGCFKKKKNWNHCFGHNLFPAITFHTCHPTEP